MKKSTGKKVFFGLASLALVLSSCHEPDHPVEPPICVADSSSSIRPSDVGYCGCGPITAMPEREQIEFEAILTLPETIQISLPMLRINGEEVGPSYLIHTDEFTDLHKSINFSLDRFRNSRVIDAIDLGQVLEIEIYSKYANYRYLGRGEGRRIHERDRNHIERNHCGYPTPTSDRFELKAFDLERVSDHVCVDYLQADRLSLLSPIRIDQPVRIALDNQVVVDECYPFIETVVDPSFAPVNRLNLKRIVNSDSRGMTLQLTGFDSIFESMDKYRRVHVAIIECPVYVKPEPRPEPLPVVDSADGLSIYPSPVIVSQKIDLFEDEKYPDSNSCDPGIGLIGKIAPLIYLN